MQRSQLKIITKLTLFNTDIHYNYRVFIFNNIYKGIIILCQSKQ